MIPIERDITIYRGIDFDLTVLAQRKNYNYDPATNTDLADLKRSYEQNLKHYGFEYDYVDFSVAYDIAELTVRKSGTSTIIETYTLEDGDITLTTQGLTISISADKTRLIQYDTADYELILSQTPDLTSMDATEKTGGVLYGSLKVLGAKA